MIRGSYDGDRQLNQLAKSAQVYPAQSYERRRTLNQLVEGILKSGHLGHPKKGSFPFSQGVYDDLYSEALSSMLMEICQKIDRYKPEQDVMAWCNFLLEKRFMDNFDRYLKKGMTHLPKDQKTQPEISLPNLEDLDHFFPAQDQVSESEELKQLIEENPNQMFTQDHIKGQSKATFQFLALEKIWRDRKWQEISAELNVPISSLYEFFKKRLKEFTPYFRDYLQS
ncbi:MAG: hypothetical protein ACRC8A_08255 [Microcoleaceae cyanobacterium]